MFVDKIFFYTFFFFEKKIFCKKKILIIMRWVVLPLLYKIGIVLSTKNIVPSNEIVNACRFSSNLYKNLYIPLGISYLEWENGGKCGACYEISSNEENFHGIVTSLCPDCERNELSLLSDQDLIVNTKAYEIPCPHWENEKPKYRTLFYEQKLKIQIVDTERPVTSVSLTNYPDKLFRKTWDNFWMIDDDSLIQFPLSITCITATGKVDHVLIEDTNTYKVIDSFL